MTEDEDDKYEDEEEDEVEDEGDNDGDELLISTCFKRGCCGSLVGPIGDSISTCLPMITSGGRCVPLAKLDAWPSALSSAAGMFPQVTADLLSWTEAAVAGLLCQIESLYRSAYRAGERGVPPMKLAAWPPALSSAAGMFLQVTADVLSRTEAAVVALCAKTFAKLQQACLLQIVASLSLWMVAASAALFSTTHVRRHVPLSGSFVPQLAAVAAALLIAPVWHYDGLIVIHSYANFRAFALEV